MHPGQLAVDAAAARRLIAAQFPAWHDLPIRAVASAGTMNALFRVGESLVDRFPLIAQDTDRARANVAREMGASRQVLGRVRFRTPVPMAMGSGDDGYPLPWSVYSWIPGTVAFDADPSDSDGFARDLAALITEIRGIDTDGRQHGGGSGAEGRGGDLVLQDDAVEAALRRSAGLLDVARLRAIWRRLRALPRADPVDVMCHGDLTPGNVLVADGRLAGVIDWNTLGPADPALDLICAWHLLDAGPRRVLRDALGVDDVQWERGAAWAFVQAVDLVWYYVDTNPTMAALGRSTLGRIVAATPASHGGS